MRIIPVLLLALTCLLSNDLDAQRRNRKQAQPATKTYLGDVRMLDLDAATSNASNEPTSYVETEE